MDVNYSDTVTNTVKNLRENVYNTRSLKEEFTSELERTLCY